MLDVFTVLFWKLTFPFKVYEFCCEDEKPVRMPDSTALLEKIAAAQEYSWFCYQCLVSWVL